MPTRSKRFAEKTPSIKKQAQKRKETELAVRQEMLRENLAARCRITHVLNNVAEMEAGGLTPQRLAELKAACDVRLRLISKYLPDLKNVEMTTTDKDGLPTQINITIGQTEPKAIEGEVIKTDEKSAT